MKARFSSSFDLHSRTLVHASFAFVYTWRRWDRCGHYRSHMHLSIRKCLQGHRHRNTPSTHRSSGIMKMKTVATPNGRKRKCSFRAPVVMWGRGGGGVGTVGGGRGGEVNRFVQSAVKRLHWFVTTFMGLPACRTSFVNTGPRRSAVPPPGMYRIVITHTVSSQH